MSNRTKIGLTIILAAAGIIFLLNGNKSEEKAVAPAPAQENVYVGRVEFTPTPTKPAETKQKPRAENSLQKDDAAQLPGEKDILNLVDVARDKGLDEAYASYQIYVNEIEQEQASNKAHLQTLLRATIALSGFDPANDHYAFLVPLYNHYPTQVEEALYDLDFDLATRADVLDTVKSFAREMAKADKH